MNYKIVKERENLYVPYKQTTFFGRSFWWPIKCGMFPCRTAHIADVVIHWHLAKNYPEHECCEEIHYKGYIIRTVNLRDNVRFTFIFRRFAFITYLISSGHNIPEYYVDVQGAKDTIDEKLDNVEVRTYEL